MAEHMIEQAEEVQKRRSVFTKMKVGSVDLNADSLPDLSRTPQAAKKNWTRMLTIGKARNSVLSDAHAVNTDIDFGHESFYSDNASKNPTVNLMVRQLNNKELSLESLYLNKCQLSDEAAICILGALTSNKILKKLYMN